MAEPPLGDHCESLAVEGVDALAPAPLHANQAGEFELPEVPAGGWPRAVEARSDLAGSHLVTVKVQRQEDLPARSVCEPSEDLVELLKLALGVALTQGQ